MRNCRGYIFRLQKQSEGNFLAFAPERGPVCRVDGTLSRGLLLEETRREVAATSQTHADTYLVLFQITVGPLMQARSTVPACGELPGRNTERRAGANPPYTVWVRVHVCRLY